MPVMEDLQAVGQERMFDMIRQTALRDERPLCGVWASFGKPYICLGEPEEPVSKLPPLFRDQLNGNDGSKQAGKGQGKQRGGKGAEQGQESTAGAVAAAAPPGSGGSRGQSRGGTGRRIGTNASMASMASNLTPEELAELRLNKAKTIIQFTTNDTVEAQFPQGPLKQSNQRRTQSKARPGSFVDPVSARHEVGDAALAYGQPRLPDRKLKPRVMTRELSRLQRDSKSIFVTQGAANLELGSVLDDEQAPRASQSGRPRASVSTMDRNYLMSDQHEGQQVSLDGTPPMMGDPTQAATSGGLFKPLVQEAVPMRGDEDNPVYAWHNNFLRVRHAGREALQGALLQRAEGRFRARTVGAMAANLSSILMADLDLVKGKQVPYASVGMQPHSPYVKMDTTWAEIQERAATAVRAAQQLDPDELRVLQRFYDQLCALVEAQRMSDPLSLMVVHKVKVLLEEGTFLQRAMFEGVVSHISAFVATTGMRKHNKYMRSILTFIAKCTGVSEADFEALLDQAGLCMVVFGSNVMPSQAAAAAAGSYAGDASGVMTHRSKGRGRINVSGLGGSTAAGNTGATTARGRPPVRQTPMGSTGSTGPAPAVHTLADTQHISLTSHGSGTVGTASAGPGTGEPAHEGPAGDAPQDPPVGEDSASVATP